MRFRYGKVALVVGASSGVGKECALFLKECGYIVYGTSRSGNFTEVNGIKMIPLDVTKSDTISEAIDYIIKDSGEIAVLINCPGIGLAGAVEDISIIEAKAIFDTNFFGIMDVCNRVLPVMRKQHRGLIVNISSVAGFISIPYQSMYSASKYALEALTECMRMEVKGFGVNVSMIEPGDMKTNFQRIYAKAYDNSAYKSSCDKAIASMIKSESNGPSPKVVIKELRKILNKRRPPIRKIVGLEYKLIGLLVRLLPNRLVEFIVSKIY